MGVRGDKVKATLIFIIVVVLATLGFVKAGNTNTVNVGNVGLPSQAIDQLRNVLKP